ncbi:hypothetical protein GOBAR_AA12368 [Gossypium barbadense]|uniref:Uncharacterized protein n=1 Tax=Gossypium barbadense TaxID=3634 RepID=A0A2P5XY46_GOSBA|nr:hypothetical protein GOBAR_AA12368 [Gossypium barbadense]
MKHARDALWGHLADESEEGCLCRRVEKTEIPCQSSHIGANGNDSSPMLLCLMANGEGDEIVKGVSKDKVQVEGRTELEHELEVRQLDDLEKEPPWGPKGNWRNGCLIFAVGPNDDATPFLFFEAEMAVFLPRRFDMVSVMARRSYRNTPQE